MRFGARKKVSMDARCGLKFPAIAMEERLHLARESAASLLAMWLENNLDEGRHIPDFSRL